VKYKKIWYTKCYMKSLHLTKPHLLIVVGIPGAGKTFFAEKFAETFNAPFIHYQALQTTPQTPLSEEETAELAGMMYREIVKTGQTIIIEGPGASRVEREALGRLARQADYEHLFIWVQTEPATARTRAVRGVRGSTNHTISDEVFDAEIRRFTPLNKGERSIVISGKHTYPSQAKIVLKRLIEPNIAARRDAPTIMSIRPSSSRISIK
jgi:predicted kinase